MKSSLFCIAVMTIVVCSVCDGKVMMEYIGNICGPVSFESVPIDPSIDFHFILAFAVNFHSRVESQYGNYTPSWSSSITPAYVRSVKAHHPNVKVLAYIFGDNTVGWYKPHDSEAWISRAFKSIQSLVTRYQLDGIDIDYELVQDDASFVYCIGQLITRLKSHQLITVAAISPNRDTAKHYIRLYRSYPSVVNYVNHQFNTDRATTPKAYLRYFRLRATQFYEPKFLPYYEAKWGIEGEGFLAALIVLASNGFQGNGVAIFSADTSKSNGYYYEKKSQAFLLGNNNTTVF